MERQIFKIIIFLWAALAPVTFLLLHFVNAPYGRYIRSGWGRKISGRTGWIIMELPAVLVILFASITEMDKWNRATITFLLLWEIHYIHRAFIFPFRVKSRGKKITLTTVIFGVIFNIVNGYLNGRYIFHFSTSYTGGYISDPRFIGGAILFISGMIINIYSDSLLINLRKKEGNGYKIPRGGLFELVSCANYFGEIMEWSGWAVMTWSIPGLLFALWTMANLIPRAKSHHKFYIENFPDYPQKRKAIFPFLL